MRRDEKYVNIILWIEIISFFLQFTFSFFYAYASAIEFCSFVPILFLMLKIKFRGKDDRWKLPIVLVAAIFCLMSMLFNSSSVGIGSIMTLFKFLAFSLLMTKFSIYKKTGKKLLAVFFLQLVLLNVVDLSVYNTNTIGLNFLVIGIYIILLLSSLYPDKFLLTLAIAAFIDFNIWLSGSRTCLMAFTLFYVGTFLSKYFFTNRTVLLVLSLLLTIGSLVYVQTYIYLWESNLVATELMQESIEATGKSVFSGRQFIWKEALELLNEKPLVGTGSKIHLQSFFMVNLHNSILNFFVIYGYVVGSLIVYLIVRMIMGLHRFMYDEIVRSCVVAYFAFLLVAFSETNLLLLPFMCSFCLFMAYARKKELSSSLVIN